MSSATLMSSTTIGYLDGWADAAMSLSAQSAARFLANHAMEPQSDWPRYADAYYRGYEERRRAMEACQ